MNFPPSPRANFWSVHIILDKYVKITFEMRRKKKGTKKMVTGTKKKMALKSQKLYFAQLSAVTGPDRL